MRRRRAARDRQRLRRLLFRAARGVDVAGRGGPGHCRGASRGRVAYGSLVSSPLSNVTAARALLVVEAVPLMADAALENASEVAGHLALVSRDSDEFQRRTGCSVAYLDKVRRAVEAGAVGVVVVNTPRDGKDGDDLSQMGDDTATGYRPNVPVFMIKGSDAARLRKRGGAVIRDKGAPSSRRVRSVRVVLDRFTRRGFRARGELAGVWSSGVADRRAVRPAPVEDPVKHHDTIMAYCDTPWHTPASEVTRARGGHRDIP